MYPASVACACTGRFKYSTSSRPFTSPLSLLPEKRRRGWQPASEHLDARLGDEHRVLELRARLSVARHRRPAVGPVRVLPRAHVDHRLDGEAVANLRNSFDGGSNTSLQVCQSGALYNALRTLGLVFCGSFS